MRQDVHAAEHIERPGIGESDVVRIGNTRDADVRAGYDCASTSAVQPPPGPEMLSERLE